MKIRRHLLTLLTALMVFPLAVSVVGQDEGAAAGKKKLKLIKISSLNSAKANKEFNRNVQLVRAQRDRLIDLQQQLQEADDDKKKAQLEEEQKQLREKFQGNNQLMQDTYGFSLRHNYYMQVEKSSIYLIVTEAEFDRITKEIKARSEKEGKKAE